MDRLIPAGTGLNYYRRAKISGEDVVDMVEQEPENIMNSLSAYDDDAKSLFAGGLDDDGHLGMGDIESPTTHCKQQAPPSRQAWRGLGSFEKPR